MLLPSAPFYFSLLFCGLLTVSSVVQAADPERGAVSTNWTSNWESGMVSGNGRMGVVVYGNPENPIVLLNHDRLYTSQYDPTGVGPAETAQFVPEIRRLIKEQGYKAALDFSFQKSRENGLARDQASDFHPGFFLNCRLTGADQATDYRRSENFQTGEIETMWHGSAGNFRMRVFVSRADNVAVLSITGPGAGQLGCSFDLGPVKSRLIRSQPLSGSDWIGFHNLYAPGNGGYDGAIRVIARGGSVKV